MDDSRTIQRHSIDNPAFHEVDDKGTETHFDRVSAHAQKHGAFRPVGLCNRPRDQFQILRGQNVREPADEGANGFTLANRFTQECRLDFAEAPADRIGFDFREVEPGKSFFRHETWSSRRKETRVDHFANDVSGQDMGFLDSRSVFC